MTEHNPSAGATPVAAGATPAQSQPPTPAVATPEAPATGYPDGMGDAGKQALDRMKADRDAARAAAKAAADELADLRISSQSDSERALGKARREGAAEALARVQVQLRRSGVKTALVAAGVGTELLDLATKDDVFADLKVDDDGEIEGLDAAVATLKKARPSLFSKAASGDFGGGNRGATPTTPPSMNELLRAASR